MSVKKIISEGIKYVSQEENISPEQIEYKVSEGRVVILKHKDKYLGIGEV